MVRRTQATWTVLEVKITVIPHAPLTEVTLVSIQAFPHDPVCLPRARTGSFQRVLPSHSQSPHEYRAPHEDKDNSCKFSCRSSKLQPNYYPYTRLSLLPLISIWRLIFFFFFSLTSKNVARSQDNCLHIFYKGFPHPLRESTYPVQEVLGNVCY